MQSIKQGQEEAAHAWSRTRHRYARYCAALGKADTPGAIMRANADLISGGMEAMGKSVSAFQHMTASMSPVRQ